MENVFKLWKRLPRKVVEWPFLEVFKNVKTLRHCLVRLGSAVLTVGLEDLKSLYQP